MEHARHHAVEHHGWIRSRGDFVIALLLGATVVAIAWGAYQAELGAKDGDHYFNRSVETLGTAHKLELQGDQEVETFEGLFLELERDRLEGRTHAAALRRRLLPPEARRAVAWWESRPDASRPPSPFVNANPRYGNA